jgi:lipoprotein-anchoring transpeptidase ErfK/SrfK
VLVVSITPVTFEDLPSEVFLPAKEVAAAFGWRYEYDPVTEIARVNGRTVDPRLPRLWDHSYLLPTAILGNFGATHDATGWQANRHVLKVTKGNKRVVIHLGGQTLSAFEGEREVIRCQVSSGRPGKETPTGRFRLGAKDRDHVSSIYHSPMPYAVHVVDGIWVHGSEWFSDAPASHGCIRLEMHGETNWAEMFYRWARPGSPVMIDLKR